MMSIGTVQEHKTTIPMKTTLAGAAIGALAAKVSPDIFNLVACTPFAQKMVDVSKTLTKDELTLVSNATKKVMESTGIAKKGVKVLYANSSNKKFVQRIMLDEVRHSLRKFLFPDWANRMFAKNLSDTVQSGVNAFYTFRNNKIILPDGKAQLLFFHEAGHAMSAHINKFGKFLQHSRLLSFATIPIMAIALLTKKKSPDEKPKGILDKTTSFIKNNAGKLTFLSQVPVILEEAFASFQGNKLAKQLLNPELAKKVAKSNRYGFVTYVIAAATTALGVYLGVRLKDKLVQPEIANKVSA